MRVSFFGGGTDYPAWYLENGGSVISTSINKYNYINVRYLPGFFNHKHCIRYYLREETQNINQIKHNSVRETLKYLKITDGVEILHNADLPARGGLGSSSSFTVGLLNALYALKGKIVSKRTLANAAIFIEQNKIKENVGSQDQIAASFGGLNKIVFNKKGNFIINPYTLKEKNAQELEQSLMIFFLGLQRNASVIAKHQIKLIPQKKKELNNILSIVSEGDKELRRNKLDIKSIGSLLDEQWNIKKYLSSKITNSKIDDVYKTAMDAGAIGGKLCGAGGGGFILFCAKKNKQKKIKEKLKKLLHIPFKFDYTGSKIVYYKNE